MGQSHLLFWLSLFPFATAWMGENRAAPAPTAVYGVTSVGRNRTTFCKA
jgi:uncharacterized membrane protein